MQTSLMDSSHSSDSEHSSDSRHSSGSLTNHSQIDQHTVAISGSADDDRTDIQSEDDPVHSSASEETISNSAIKWTRKQKVTLVILLLVMFDGSVMYSLLGPFFPVEAKDRGASVFQTGLVFGVYQLVMFVMSPVYGNLVVKLRPKFMCVAGSFIVGTCCILFGLLAYTTGSTFLILCLVLRSFEANGAAMLQVAGLSQLIRTFPGETATISSYAEAVIGLGFVFGPLLGGALFTAGGYLLPFVCAGGWFYVSCFLLIFILPDIDETESQSQNFLKLLTYPGVLLISVHCAIATLVMSFFDPILSDWMEDTFHVSVVIVTIMFAVWSGSYALYAPVVGKLSAKGYIYSQMIGGLFISALSYLFFAPSPLLDFIFHGQKYLWLVVVVFIIIGCASAAVYVPPFQAIADLLEVNGHELNLKTIGMISGLIGSAYSLGSFIGPSVSGLLNDNYGFAWACTAVSAPTLLMGILMSFYVGIMKCTRKPLKPLKPEVNSSNDEERQKLLG